LRDGDLALAARVRWGAPEGAPPRPAEGWVVRRAVAAGTTLEAPIVTPPPVVAAGTQVSVEWVSGEISVRFEGTALHDAALGERVLVRPAGRAGAVRGTVTGPAAVRLAL
jgi:flagella basal body P-ring formation protein FlgA